MLYARPLLSALLLPAVIRCSVLLGTITVYKHCGVVLETSTPTIYNANTMTTSREVWFGGDGISTTSLEDTSIVSLANSGSTPTDPSIASITSEASTMDWTTSYSPTALNNGSHSLELTPSPTSLYLQTLSSRKANTTTSGVQIFTTATTTISEDPMSSSGISTTLTPSAFTSWSSTEATEKSINSTIQTPLSTTTIPSPTAQNISLTTTAPAITTTACTLAPAVNVICPASNGTLFTPEGECTDLDNSYVINCGLSIPGNNLLVIGGVQDAESCISQCTDDDTCIAVAFNSTTSTCYEMNSVSLGNVTVTSQSFVFALNLRYAISEGYTYANTTPTSTALPPCTSQPISSACPACDNSNLIIPDGTVWRVNCNEAYGTFNLGGNLVQKRQGGDLDACLATCEPDTTCAGFSWYGGECTTFSDVPDTWTAVDGAVSGRKAVGLVVEIGG